MDLVLTDKMTFRVYRLVYSVLSPVSLWTHFKSKMSVIKEDACSYRRSLLTLYFISTMGPLGSLSQAILIHLFIFVEPFNSRYWGYDGEYARQGFVLVKLKSTRRCRY